MFHNHGSTYRTPSYNTEQDITLEKNFENVNLLNKQIFLLNINTTEIEQKMINLDLKKAYKVYTLCNLLTL